MLRGRKNAALAKAIRRHQNPVAVEKTALNSNLLPQQPPCRTRLRLSPAVTAKKMIKDAKPFKKQYNQIKQYLLKTENQV